MYKNRWRPSIIAGAFTIEPYIHHRALLLKHANNLSKTLQNLDLSAADFDLLYQKIIKWKEGLRDRVGNPILSRWWQAPLHYQIGNTSQVCSVISSFTQSQILPMSHWCNWDPFQPERISYLSATTGCHNICIQWGTPCWIDEQNVIYEGDLKKGDLDATSDELWWALMRLKTYQQSAMATRWLSILTGRRQTKSIWLTLLVILIQNHDQKLKISGSFTF